MNRVKILLKYLIFVEMSNRHDNQTILPVIYKFIAGFKTKID